MSPYRDWFEGTLPQGVGGSLWGLVAGHELSPVWVDFSKSAGQSEQQLAVRVCRPVRTDSKAYFSRGRGVGSLNA